MLAVGFFLVAFYFTLLNGGSVLYLFLIVYVSEGCEVSFAFKAVIYAFLYQTVSLDTQRDAGVEVV